MANLNPPPRRVPQGVTPEVRAYINELNRSVYQMWYELNQLLNNSQTGYTTFSNLTTVRTLDADATSVAELADALGTLVEDLKAKSLISE